MGHSARIARAKQGLMVGDEEGVSGIVVSSNDARLLDINVFDRDRIFITHFADDFKKYKEAITAIKVKGTEEQYVYIPAAIRPLA